jgi:hypothetical protein
MLKVNDVVVGNAMANKYGLTCQGWVGVVTSIDEGDSNRMWIRPFNGSDDDRYHVSMECFDLYLRTKETITPEPVKVSKQELLDVLSNQTDCYYSLAQVVDMIKSIEDPKPVLYSKVQVTAEGYDSFLDCVRDRFEANFAGHGGTNRFIDLDTADFSLNSNNTVELDSVDLDADEVVDTAMECLENVLIQYVEVLEKSDLLEA